LAGFKVTPEAKAKEAVRVGTGTLSLEALKLALKMLMEHGVKAALSKAV
jgi:hypothetical protein